MTSPSYYGVITPIAPLAELCHENGMALLVDQAHGAHFPAVGLPSAAAQGADLSVVSTHKTWPSLGSSAVLYIGRNASYQRLELKKTAQIFGTTSPSFPILASIDYARAYLEGAGGQDYRHCAEQVSRLRQWLSRETPFRPLTDSAEILLDPCRLTIDTLSGGLTGIYADRLLQEKGIYAEMSDLRHLVLILTCNDRPSDLTRLKEGLAALSGKVSSAHPGALLSAAPEPLPRLSLRQAVFGSRESMPLRDAAGRISADFIAPYPPGIPVIAPGEEITEKHIAYLEKKSYNIDNDVYVHIS